MATKTGQKIVLNIIRARINLLSVISPSRAADKALLMFQTPFMKVKKKMPPIFTKAEELHLDLEGIRLVGYRWNPGGLKRLLLVHGFDSNVFNFERYVTPFVKRGYQVLAFDGPAHGRSGGKTINLPQYIRMVDRIDQVFGPLDAFIAHSFGGLAVTQWLEHREHDEHMKVVLIAPATETSTAVKGFMDILQLNERTREIFQARLETAAGVPVSHYSIPRVAPGIRAQVLWAHDQEDDVTPFQDTLPVRALGLPNFKFLDTRGLGHRRIYRDNDVRRSIIHFLTPEGWSEPTRGGEKPGLPA